MSFFCLHFYRVYLKNCTFHSRFSSPIFVFPLQNLAFGHFNRSVRSDFACVGFTLSPFVIFRLFRCISCLGMLFLFVAFQFFSSPSLQLSFGLLLSALLNFATFAFAGLFQRFSCVTLAHLEQGGQTSRNSSCKVALVPCPFT